MGTLRWVAYETFTKEQNSDEDEAKKPNELDYESDSSDYKRRICYLNKRNYYDDEENSVESAKSQDEGSFDEVVKSEKLWFFQWHNFSIIQSLTLSLQTRDQTTKKTCLPMRRSQEPAVSTFGELARFY